MKRAQVFAAVAAERERQRDMWSTAHGWGFGDCSSDRVDMPVKLAVLAEELGEAAHAFLEKDDEAFRVEMTQVAAVAVAILEGLA